MDKKTLILIDGHALAFRSYFALERTGMKTTDNEPTWAVFGFFKAIIDLLKNKRIKIDAIATTFDVGRQTFRTEEYKEYKANRETMPDTLQSQMGLIMEGLRSFNIPIYTKEGFEADDVIGTIARKAKELGHKTLILTGDQDSFQLIDKEGLVKVLIPSKGLLTEYDWDKVYEKLNVYPDQVADYKGLRGDTSDNIPGIRGIGEKTASKLLNKYQTLDNVLNHVDEITEKALKQKLLDGKDIAVLSRYLATIKTDVEVDFDFDHTSLEVPDVNKVIAFFKRVQFQSFVRNINDIMSPFTFEVNQEPVMQTQEQSSPVGQLGLFAQGEQKPLQFIPKNNEFEKVLVDTDEKFKEFFGLLKTQSVFALDTETTSLDTMEAELVGISIAFNPHLVNKNGKIAIDKTKPDVTKSYFVIYNESFIEQLKPVLMDDTILKSFQNAKYDLNVLKNYGVSVEGIAFDTMLASYVKDPARRHGLKVQAMEHLDFMMNDFESLVGKGKTSIPIKDVDVQQLSDYACDDAYATLELTRFWLLKLNDEEQELLYGIELPLEIVLADMEKIGISIDVDYLKNLSEELGKKLFDIEQKIYEEAGTNFNINSPKQVSEILFEKLQIKPKKKSKQKTSFSTSAKILEELSIEYPIAKKILEQRHLAKLKSTYIDSLPLLISKKDGRIHTSYNQTVTTTGRLSSSNPNLQNIPIRTELGNRIRGAFVPRDRDNYSILSADYSQIELRLLAHVSGDKALIESFCRDIDIHTLTASKIFNVEEKDITKDMRRKAKAVNFGIIYGQTRYGLASTLSITPLEAQNFIDIYFQTYPNVKKYMIDTVQKAYETGYVSTIYGRKRYLLDELSSSNHQIKEFAERAAINAPLQGASADLIKLAMINLQDELKKQNLQSKMIMQVHDELVLEVLNSELEKVQALVVKCMELNQPLKVPLKVDVAVGTSWLEK